MMRTVSDPVKIALIMALAIIISILLVIYLSPYRTCVRALTAEGVDSPEAHCLRLSGSR
jgi:hypothetical protein